MTLTLVVDRSYSDQIPIEMFLTTEHPQSSHGLPVLLDATGNRYDPRDIVPGTGRRADQCVEIAEGRYEQVSPEADKLISQFLGRKSW